MSTAGSDNLGSLDSGEGPAARPGSPEGEGRGGGDGGGGGGGDDDDDATSNVPSVVPAFNSPGGGTSIAEVRLVVDPTSAEAPFRQLKAQIVEGVTRGALTTGTRLPTVRKLAEEVGVSTATAAKVYRELEESGILEGRGRSGTFVAAADQPSAVLARAAEEFVELASSAGFGIDDAVAAVRDVFGRRP